MLTIGIDCGASSVKLVGLSDKNELFYSVRQAHYGRLKETLNKIIGDFLERHPEGAGYPVFVTGSGGAALEKRHSEIPFLGDIPAISEGARLLCPKASSVVEIGSQHARYLTGLLEDMPPRFSENEHCAGGTGSFFEDQMSRLGLRIENYSEMVAEALSIPRLSGRCAVFAKTDIIHRQQEGAPVSDILLGLCYAMIRNYKAVIVKNLPLKTPVALCGGVGYNSGVIRAMKDVFGLKDGDFLLPEHFLFTGAAGAALEAKARGGFLLGSLISLLKSEAVGANSLPRLPVLSLRPDTHLEDPGCAKAFEGEECALGIDIGSTSTNLVLTGKDGALLDYQYLRTAGNPEKAVRLGFESIKSRFPKLRVLAVGVTGSGRERIGKLVGADAIRDEITAQARAASQWAPDADTVFEIGGQDSKYISLFKGQAADFQMNKICAAGTGSFIEEQAVRMGIPLSEFGEMAQRSRAPVELGERCTVFIETAIASALAQGAKKEDIAAGLCHSIVRNYLHKVVGSKPVGEKIILQGGIAYNPGIVAAFQSFFGGRIRVSPFFSISGAYGVSILAVEDMKGKASIFKGFDMSGQTAEGSPGLKKEIQKNIAFYKQADKLLLKGYDGNRDAGKKTVGIPFVLMMHKFFPMANAFFRDLGFNVLLSTPTNEKTIELSQQYAQGETCYPVKLIHGHMAELAEQGADYIFLPSIHTMKHEHSNVRHNYGCVYMQTAPGLVARAIRLEDRGIELLNPVFDLDFGKEAMASSMLEIGKRLGFSKPRCMKALLAGAMAVRRHTAAVEKQGKLLLESLGPEERVLVLITRNYGISDPVLSMKIPELLLERGHKVITLSHLPAHDLDISKEYPNLYWPFGQHILSGAKLVRRHPNLYAVYLTNHGCGPDTMLSHMFRQEMGDKPYLQIEVDEHFSNVGVITRIEAFLNSLGEQPAKSLPKDFKLTGIDVMDSGIHLKPEREKTLWLPRLSFYSDLLADYISRSYGLNARIMPPADTAVLALGRAETSSKEYLPFVAALGSVLQLAKKEKEPIQYLLPATEGSEADGLYSRAVQAILCRKKLEGRVSLVSPVLETLLQTAADPDLLFRAVITGDLLLCAAPRQRAALLPERILDWQELSKLAAEIGASQQQGLKILALGVPEMLFGLNDGVPAELEGEGYVLRYAPLSEYLWLLWRDRAEDKRILDILETYREKMSELCKALGPQSSFSRDIDALREEADRKLPGFAGAGGRYRCAKMEKLPDGTDAVLTIAPRYENTALILEMAGTNCPLPSYSLSMDSDWDEASWSSLRSFLYYVEKQKNREAL